jgi:hypothetical protein
MNNLFALLEGILVGSFLIAALYVITLALRSCL